MCVIVADIGAGIPPVIFQIVVYTLDGLWDKAGIGVIPVWINLGVARLACVGIFVLNIT